VCFCGLSQERRTPCKTEREGGGNQLTKDAWNNGCVWARDVSRHRQMKTAYDCASVDLVYVPGDQPTMSRVRLTAQ